MSHYSDIILVATKSDRRTGCIDLLNKWLDANHVWSPKLELASAATPETVQSSLCYNGDVFMTMVNELKTDEFLEQVLIAPWFIRDNITIMIRDEYDDRHKVYQFDSEGVLLEDGKPYAVSSRRFEYPDTGRVTRQPDQIPNHLVHVIEPGNGSKPYLELTLANTGHRFVLADKLQENDYPARIAALKAMMPIILKELSSQ